MPRGSVKHWVPDDCRGSWFLEKQGDLWGYAIYTNAKGRPVLPDEEAYRRTFKEIPGLSIIYNSVVQFTEDLACRSYIMKEAARRLVHDSEDKGKKFFQEFANALNMTVLGHFGPLLPQLEEYHRYSPLPPRLEFYHRYDSLLDEEPEPDDSVFEETSDSDVIVNGEKHWVPDEIRGYYAIEKSGNVLGAALYVDNKGNDMWPDWGTHYRIFMEIPKLIELYNAVIQVTSNKNLQYAIMDEAAYALFAYNKEFHKKYFETFAYEVNEHVLGHRGFPLRRIEEYSLNEIHDYKEPGPDDFTEWELDDDIWDEEGEVTNRVIKKSYFIDQT